MYTVGVNGNIGRRNYIASGIHYVSCRSARQNDKNNQQINKNFQPLEDAVWERQNCPYRFFPVRLSLPVRQAGRQALLFANTSCFDFLLGEKFPFQPIGNFRSF